MWRTSEMLSQESRTDCTSTSQCKDLCQDCKWLCRTLIVQGSCKFFIRSRIYEINCWPEHSSSTSRVSPQSGSLWISRWTVSAITLYQIMRRHNIRITTVLLRLLSAMQVKVNYSTAHHISPMLLIAVIKACRWWTSNTLEWAHRKRRIWLICSILSMCIHWKNEKLDPQPWNSLFISIFCQSAFYQ